MIFLCFHRTGHGCSKKGWPGQRGSRFSGTTRSSQRTGSLGHLERNMKKTEKCGGVLNIRIKSETYIFPRYICRLCPYLRNMDKYGYLVGYPARYQNLFDPWGLLSCGISGRSGSGTCRTVRHQENKLGSWRFISK